MSIKFPCPRCKKAIRVPDTLAGKMAKCPYCAAAVNVPAGAVRVAAVAAKADPRSEFSALKHQVQSPTGGGKPYKRQRGDPMMKLLFLTLALAVLGGGIFAAFKFNLIGFKSAPSSEVAKAPTDTKPAAGSNREAPSTQPATSPKDNTPPPLTDSHFFPDGTVAIANLNFEAALNSKLYDKLKEEAAKMDQSPEKLFDAQLKPRLGLQLTSLSRVVVVAGAGDDMLAVVRPRNPVTIDEIKLNKKGEYKEVKVGRFTVYESGMDAYCLAEDRLLVTGPPALVKKVLERNKPPELKPELDAVYKLLNPAKPAALALLVQETEKEVAKSLPGGGIPKTPEFEPVTQAKTLVLQVDLAQGLEIAATLQCKDAEAAAAVKKLADALVGVAKMEIEKFKKDKEGMPEEMLAKKAEEIVNQLKIAADGPSFTVTLALNDALTAQLLELVKAFQMAKPPNQ